MKAKLIDYISEQLRLHGLSFLLLGVMVYYFYEKVERLSDEVKSCNQAVIQVYQEERTELRQVIERNTIALENLR